MARTLPATVTAGIAAAVTAPGYLIEIVTAEATLRYSTRGTLTYLGQTYTGGASVSGLGLGGSELTASVTLPNADSALAALVLRGELNDQPVTLRAIYADAPVESVLVFTGAVDAASDIGLLSVTLGLAAARETYWQLPWVSIGPPIFNHLRRPGESLMWGGQHVILESSEFA